MTVEDRFWAKVDKSGECWLWLGSMNAKGYGRFMLHGKARRTHRVSWEIANGPVPDGLFVLHSCDNPPCVKPAHLWLGTNAANMADAGRKGRISRAKLSPESVVAIRSAASAGVAKKALARQYGVRHTTILRLIQRKTWRHVA